MSNPSTPKKQLAVAKVEQFLTPPLSATNHGTTEQIEPGSHVRRLKFDDSGLHQGIKREGEEDGPSQSRWTPSASEASAPVPATQRLPDRTRGPEDNGQPQSEVRRWLDSSKTPEQNRNRFLTFLHSLYPSNDAFYSAGHPLYDPEEDGPEEFFLRQVWDGHCPHYDDDYDPTKDPSQSKELWQPQIGDEAIENDEDLGIVLRARAKHQARSRALKKCRDRFIHTQMQAGVKYADIDWLQFFANPRMDSDGSSSEYETDSSDSEVEKTAIKKESSPSVTLPVLPDKSVLQPTITTKGIRVFGGRERTSSRGRPQGSKNKKPRKRKRGKYNPNGTYKDSGDEEDHISFHKKSKFAAKSNPDDSVWRAQTRAAARRTEHGMDGAYESDAAEDYIGAISGEDQLSDSVGGPKATREIIGNNESNSLLSRFTSSLSF
ncbi:hypothetical protein F4808DRAFT_474106 [Astrocystis sublimbata]|nr:hypothetical protein F4808DRAFT_474106 [Astrocystis sublimbata]